MTGQGQEAAARRLILWDVDGTLVSCGPSGREALEAGARLAGRLDAVPHLPMGGKTDPQIIGEMLLAAGVARADIDALVPVALAEAERALAGWRERMGREGHVHPGVRRLLDELAGRDGVRQTLLTGNLAVNAAVKVGAFGLDGFFDLPIGAYGDDHEERERLVPVALRRAGELRGEAYLPEQVWVIGDTARDLACARAGGVRCLIVGTGHDGFGAVRDLEADAVMEDLGDTARVLKVLLG
ncbi:MAG TPA: hydrolase [Chloroflexi bacterium]|nr:hydrolase [Chloroflexota bacterium]